MYEHEGDVGVASTRRKSISNNKERELVFKAQKKKIEILLTGRKEEEKKKKSFFGRGVKEISYTRLIFDQSHSTHQINY